jgi:phosphate starvation-inducible PhoH-like protein
MNEKNIFLDSSSLIEFYGQNNINTEKIKQFFPKMKIVFRGDMVIASGEPDEVSIFEIFIERLQNHLDKYNKIDPQNIEQIYREEKNEFLNDDNILIFGRSGQPVKPRTEGQKRLIEAYEKDDLIFAIGPAGTGKTYLAITLAIRALKRKEIKKIILSRPAVEAGESLGFLPGDMKEKLDPYLQALYDALHDMIPGKKLNEYIEQGIVQIAPLAYMRGRTLSDSFVILDEAQNTTINQLKMFLTRMGENSKFIVTGDITQIDLPDIRKSGLLKVKEILRNIKGISFVFFDKRDIIRHKLVSPIIDAFENDLANR